jgi:hypothetical protein
MFDVHPCTAVPLRPAFFENLDYEPEGATTMGRWREIIFKKQSKISHLKKKS